MTTIVKAANAADFLSLVPRMLGFRPQRSLVLIPFDGSRSLGGMRFDLPDPTTGDEVDRIAATVIGLACRVSGADTIALVAYTDAALDASSDADARPTLPHAEFLAALLSRADACGLRVSDALCVAADGWGRYLDPGGPVHALDELRDAEAATDDVDTSQLVGADLPTVPDELSDAVTRALDAFTRAVRVVCGPDAASRPSAASAPPPPARAQDARIDPQALEAVCVLDDLPTFFESVLGRDAATLTAYEIAQLAWCLSRPALRDIALVQWCIGLSGGDEALDAQLRWEAGEEYPTRLAMRMWGEGEQPDVERLGRALALVRWVAAGIPDELRPGPLATAAWISWAFGRSTHADLYAIRACEIEPEHGLAEIVRSFVSAGHLPDWAFTGSRRGRRKAGRSAPGRLR